MFPIEVAHIKYKISFHTRQVLCHAGGYLRNAYKFQSEKLKGPDSQELLDVKLFWDRRHYSGKKSLCITLQFKYWYCDQVYFYCIQYLRMEEQKERKLPKFQFCVRFVVASVPKGLGLFTTSLGPDADSYQKPTHPFTFFQIIYQINCASPALSQCQKFVIQNV